MDNEERLQSGSSEKEGMNYSMAESSNAKQPRKGKAPLKPRKSKAFLKADAQRKRKYRQGMKEMEVELYELRNKCKTFEDDIDALRIENKTFGDDNKKLRDISQGLKKGLEKAHTTIEQMRKDNEALQSQNKKLDKVALDATLQMISTNKKSAAHETDEILIRHMLVEAKKMPEFQKFFVAFRNDIAAKAKEYAQIVLHES